MLFRLNVMMFSQPIQLMEYLLFNLYVKRKRFLSFYSILKVFKIALKLIFCEFNTTLRASEKSYFNINEAWYSDKVCTQF